MPLQYPDHTPSKSRQTPTHTHPHHVRCVADAANQTQVGGGSVVARGGFATIGCYSDILTACGDCIAMAHDKYGCAK